ncbi:hypothetical protein SH139x_005206 [Planctomycetaceae bacterium SH139]
MKTFTPFQYVLLTAFTLASLQTMAAERWDPTKLADFPEPPPPLKLVEAFPHLEIPKLIALNRIPNTDQLNRPLPCAEGINPDNAISQLAKLNSSGLLRDVKPDQDFSELPSLANPYHANADLTTRVRSYLHVNCADCHVDAGGGNAKIVLDNYTKLDNMALLNQPPLHTNLQIEQARLIAIGKPSHSVLLARMARRGLSQMPPLATNRVDQRAVQLIQEWIESLRAE